MASVNIAREFTIIYICFSLALLSVFLGQGDEAKLCPGTRNAAAVPAVWLQPDEAGLTRFCGLRADPTLHGSTGKLCLAWE